MRYLILPPEVNSARLFAGAGSAPMLFAATAWDGVARELALAAAGFESLISALANEAWQGRAAASMLVAATPYAGWLRAAATGAENSAGNAWATVRAFEAALQGSVPPQVVTVNRAHLLSLTARNFFGQNFPAIAATETEYEQMWIQDAAAMAGYHADVSIAAASLTPWQNLPPPLLGLAHDASIGIRNAFGVNLGFGNSGRGNIGSGNTGDYNPGSGNTGNWNLGSGNIGSYNVGSGNLGKHGTPGYGNVGSGNTGNWNLGSGKFGAMNAGNGNFGDRTNGNGDTGAGN
ncbi:PPE family protein [Mycobacterium persicum]|uniref:PPE family protein n=1 Tax=Mycobacterium persicum TaxID=1487726 RepID=UPI0013C3308F|nr:PPE family protein [Mycobacterium persicum]